MGRAALAVSLVGLMAATSACSTSPGGGGADATRSGVSVAATPSFTGTTWRLSSVESSGRTRIIGADVDAMVQFDGNGEFLGSDGVNALSGEWRLDRGRLSVDAATTLVAYGGDDADVLAAIEGLESIVVRDEGAKGTVVVDRDGPDLVLRSPTHRLTFTPAGASTPVPTAPPSATATR